MKRNFIVRLLAAVCLLALVGLGANGMAMVWTNTAGGDWNDATNWDPNVVPGAGDIVQITNVGTYTITVNGTATLGFLALEAASGTQTLAVGPNGLSCSGDIYMGWYGVLQVNGPLQAGTIYDSGTVNWQSGSIQANVLISVVGALNISGDTDKYLAAGAVLNNYGNTRWSGLGAIRGEDFDFGPGHPQIQNNEGGVFEIDNDSLLQLDNPSDASLALIFANSGTLRKVAGSGQTIFNNVQFSNTGTVDVEQGTIQFATFNNGGFSSAGLFTVAAGTSVQFNGGTCTFLPGNMVQGGGTFGVVNSGMPVNLFGQLAGRFDWSGDSLSGQWSIATNGVLNISGDTTKYLAPGASLTNYGVVHWSGLGSLNGEDFDFGPGHPTIANMPGGLFEIDSDSLLQLDNASDPTLAFIFVNGGTLRKVAGGGQTIFNNVQFSNTGTVDVEQGTIQFATFNNGGFSSAGLFTVAAGTSVQFNGGTCTFLPGNLAQGDGFFGVVNGGMPVNLFGQLAGHFDWSGDSLSGQWSIATNGVLNISGDTTKYLAPGAALTNYGVVHWTGLGSLNGEDFDFSPGHPTIANMPGGLFEIDNDSLLQLDSSVYDPNLAFVFINAGTISKVSGAGVTEFSNVQFSNTGTVDMQQGTLAMDGYGSVWEDSGLLRLAVFGTNTYSRIQSSGTANLTSEVQMILQNGYLPVAGDSFELLTYAVKNVAFSSIDLPPSSPGTYLAAVVDTNSLVVVTRQEPVANPDSFTLNENSGADLNVLSNDNLNSAGTIASFTQPANGTVTLNPDNTLHYVPALNFYGTDGFTYEARNADGHLASGTVTLQVLHVNQPPVLAPLADQTVDEQTLLTFRAQATDPDGNQLSFTLGAGAAPGAQIDPGTGVFTWTPSEAQGPGSYSITVTVTDNGTPSLSASQSFNVTVREVNTAPVLASIANQTVAELQPLSLQLSASDSDLPPNGLTFFLVSGPTGLVVTPGGQVSWTPSEAQGPSTNLVSVAVKDDGQPSLSATQSFAVGVTEVNTAPVLPAQTNLVIDELTLLTVTNTATDTDIPANVLTYTLINPPDGATIDTNGIITWTPSEAQGPSSNLLVTVVTDNGQPALSATNSFVVLVNEVNLPPSLTPVATQSIPEQAPFGLQLVATDPDLPANHLTFGLVSGPVGLSVSADGLVSWTPTEIQGPSTNQVVVQVTDDGTPSLSATQSFTVVVTEVNTAPTLMPIGEQTAIPGQTLSFNCSATDPDIPLNTLTYSLDSGPSGASITADGVFSWTPSFAQAPSTNTAVVRVTDNGVPPLSSTQAFPIVVLNTGLKGDYFAGTNFDALMLSRDDAQVNFNWAAGAPAPGLPTNQFSVRWTGQVVPRYTQTYTFYTISDDGVRLWVDGQPIINNWTVHTATTNTGTIALTAGQAYMLRLEYFDATSNAVSTLMWSSTNQTKEIVPTSQLFCTGYSDIISNAIYRFTPKLATGKCMEVQNGGTADGATVDVNNWKGNNYQKWQAVGVGSNYFKLIPQHALTKVLELNGGYTTNGTKIQITTDNGTARQQLLFIDAGQGWFKIQPQPAPGSVLDLKGGNTANGTPVQLNQDLGANSQLWRLDRQ